jgi:hypothetical protein
MKERWSVEDREANPLPRAAERDWTGFSDMEIVN